ncbi:transketolase C-terminal domain-containing protein [Bradyrhizobium sp. 87]|uniref:transketolase family protein n=1 Tax=Bradyrhizobium sp. 87 TaxID=2782682 RepID=UPI001FF9963F|nr:transketolase C-terminal domain-containing protein [Bradyrhizobium sp. 87]MCK1425868.1 transketolase [Bradyrhizobium sp. 87]
MHETLIKTLNTIATHDRRIVFVGSDLPYNDMKELRLAFPQRFFMEGIAEQYVVGMAAGLASGGLIPYVHAMAAFITRRAFEQVFIDIGLQRLPVRLVGSGCGLDLTTLGPTHMALEDVALLRQVPNMGICIPRSAKELQRLMLSSIEWDGPLYIRLTYDQASKNGRGPIGEMGRACVLRSGKEALIVSTGVVSSAIYEVEELLVQGGLDPEVLHFPTLRPFDSESLCISAGKTDKVIVVEEHHRDGGLGSKVIETLADANILRPTTRIGTWFEPSLSYGAPADAAASFGLRGSALANAILAASGRALRSIWPIVAE